MVLVIAQVIGYMLSKFYGIRIIAGMDPAKRAGFIVKLVLTAWVSLLLFGLVPAPYNFVFMFINGLPLGMVWGLVFGFVEGRRTTELMGAVLATSFIFASGLAKTVGKSILLYAGVSEFWMPFAAGARFHRPARCWHLAAQPDAAAKRGGCRPANDPAADGEGGAQELSADLWLCTYPSRYSLCDAHRPAGFHGGFCQ